MMGVGAVRAAETLIMPLPCCSAGLFIAVAVAVRSALIWSGVAVGRCWMSRAAAPEVTAAACDVPDPRKRPEQVSGSYTRAGGYFVSRYEPGTRRLAT